MNASAIQPPETWRVGRFEVHRFPALRSTNTWLKDRAADQPAYTVVWAEAQTAGRGRMERRWHAVPGNDLCVSVLLPLDGLPAARRPVLALLAACAVCRLLDGRGLRTSVKWPNDVLAGGRKIAGILCETAGAPDSPRLVVGIGLNVNSRPSDWAALGLPATSLRAETGGKADLRAVLEDLLGALGFVWDRFQADGPARLLDDLEGRLAFRNETVSLAFHGERWQGIVRGLASDGCLLLERAGLGIVPVATGELVRPCPEGPS